MNALNNWYKHVLCLVQRASLFVLAVYFWLLSSPLVWAAKKKAKEVAPPTKSYVLPYLIVLALLAVGLMTVCRPGGRRDRVEEKVKDKEE